MVYDHKKKQRKKTKKQKKEEIIFLLKKNSLFSDGIIYTFDVKKGNFFLEEI